MSCDLYQLRAFFVLAKTLNFTEAAKKLHVTQPAVSHALKKLESSLNCRLLEKRGNRPLLTDNGKLLYDACEDIFYGLEKTEESIQWNCRNLLGHIRLGATVEFGNSVLIKNMKTFLTERSDIKIDFQFSHDLLPGLLNDDLDIIIDCQNHAHSQLEKSVLFREQYVVTAAPEYARLRKIRRPKDLEACRIISMDKDCAWWERFLQAVTERERPRFREVMEINHLRGIIHATLEGIGVALIPKYCISGDLRGRRLKSLFPKLTILEDHFYIYQKKKKSGLQAHQRLVDYLMNIKPAEFGES